MLGRISILIAVFGANLLFAGTALIKSTDGGRTWIDIDPGLPLAGIVELQVVGDGSQVYALATNRTRMENLFSGPADYSVLSSSDAGRTWRELELLRVTGASYASLAAAASDPQTIYVASGFPDWFQPVFALRRTAFVLQKSTDGGRTVTTFKMSDADVLSLTERNGLLWVVPGRLSVPAGAANLFLASVWSWSIDFDSTYSGTLFSADGGTSWQFSRRVGLTQVQAEPAEPSTLYGRHVDPAGDGTPKRYIAKSSDGGKEWSLKLSEVASFALHPHDAGVLIASRNNGSLWKSTDGAENWEQLGTFLPFADMGLNFGMTADRMAIYPSKPSLVVAQAPALPHQGSNTGEIFQIHDDGGGSSVTATGMDGFTFVFDPHDLNTVYGFSEKRLEPRLRAPYIRNMAGGSVLAPGSLFSIYGEDLAGGVTFNGQPANITFASRRQINGQIPVDLKAGQVGVEVTRQPPDAASLVDRQSITLSAAAPVVLHDSSGAAHIYHSDTERRVTAADPALAGERIVVYCTGVGQMAKPWVQFWPTDQPGGVHPTEFVESVAGQPGVHRVGVEIPESLRTGSYLLLFWGGRNFGRVEVR